MVDVTGEDDVHLLAVQHLHQLGRAPNDGVDGRVLDINQWMVADENAHLVVGRVAELAVDEVDLVLRNHAVGPVPVRQDRTRRVDADDEAMVVFMHRIDHGEDMGAIALHGVEKALHRVEARNIVVSGYGEDRRGDAVDKFLRLPEFAVAADLGEIAAEDDKVGTLALYLVKEGFNDHRVGLAEMEVGGVKDNAHAAITNRLKDSERAEPEQRS